MILLLLSLACAKQELPRYEAGILTLATAFRAKQTCSCLFVMGRDEAFCTEWTRVEPDVARTTVDWEGKRVTARALGLSPTSARYVDARTGCVLE